MKLTIEEMITKTYNVDVDEVLKVLDDSVVLAEKRKSSTIQVDRKLLKTSAMVIRELIKRNAVSAPYCPCENKELSLEETMNRFFNNFLWSSYK